MFSVLRDMADRTDAVNTNGNSVRATMIQGYEKGPNFMNFDSPTYMEDSCIDVDECDPGQEITD